jgi:hypothetical protein
MSGYRAQRDRPGPFQSPPQKLSPAAQDQEKINLHQTPSKTTQNPHVKPPTTPKPSKHPINTGDFSPPTLAYLPPPTRYNLTRQRNPNPLDPPHPRRPRAKGPTYTSLGRSPRSTTLTLEGQRPGIYRRGSQAPAQKPPITPMDGILYQQHLYNHRLTDKNAVTPMDRYLYQ